MDTSTTTITHHGLLFRAAPSIRQSQLSFIPTPDDLDGELDRKLNIKPTIISDLPDGIVWAERFIILALEVMAGARPIAQLSRWCSRKVFTYLIENIHPKKTIPKIGKLHIGRPIEECMEVVLLLHSPARKRALMARFEALEGRWLCTCLQIL